MPQQPRKPPKSPFDIASEALTAARDTAGVPNFSPTPAPAGATFTPPNVTGPVVVGGYEGPAQTPGGLVGPSARDIGIARQAAIAQDATPEGVVVSPEQSIQRVGPGGGFLPTMSNQDVTNRLPDTPPPSMTGNFDPTQGGPSSIGAYLDEFYKANATPEAVKDTVVGDFKGRSEQNNDYWRQVINNETKKRYEDWQAAGSPETPVGESDPSRKSWANTDIMKQRMEIDGAIASGKEMPNLEPAYDPVTKRTLTPASRNVFVPGIEGTNINQPDGRIDQFKPGVGYSGSIFSGASLETARDIYSRQTASTPQTGTLQGVGQVPIDPKPAQAQQVPLPGGGFATTPTAPMPENVSRVITAPSGQVIGWARQFDSPEAAQAASNAARTAQAPAADPKKPKGQAA